MDQSALPPAARLAALIEAGAAANPDLRHGRHDFYNHKKKSACALGFAAFAAGAERSAMGIASFPTVERALGMGWAVDNLLGQVSGMNDCGFSIFEICRSLREGELAKVPA
jgi:hypothetical protein